MKRTGTPEGYRAAFDEIVARVQASLQGAQPGVFPIRMYVAGGAALHLLTGARVTEDVDATFSKRMLLGQDIEVSYRDADGRARLLYLDRNYNDSLGLLHENAYRDANPVQVPGVDRKRIEVRVLSALDLAVSKLARFADQDREDIVLLAERGLIDAAALRKRVTEALGGYVGDTRPVLNSLEIACRLIDAKRAAGPRRRKRRGG